MHEHSSNRMQLLRFLSLLWGLFSQTTHPGSQLLNSNGPGAIWDGRGNMRWGRKGEECMCVWGGKDKSTMVMSQTDWAFRGKNDTPGISTTLRLKTHPLGQWLLWQSWGCGSISKPYLWGFIHFYIYISSLRLIHKHTHKDNKENRGRKTIPLTTLSR